jgi:head-tail adaptor
MYRPREAEQMTTPLGLQIPTSTRINGVLKKTFTDIPGVIWANFKTFGGTEITTNGVLAVEETASIVCWYRPDIKSNCRIVRLEDGKDEKGNYNAVFEIVGDPENLERRNMFLKFKVKRVKGGA